MLLNFLNPRIWTSICLMFVVTLSWHFTLTIQSLSFSPDSLSLSYPHLCCPYKVLSVCANCDFVIWVYCHIYVLFTGFSLSYVRFTSFHMLRDSVYCSIIHLYTTWVSARVLTIWLLIICFSKAIKTYFIKWPLASNNGLAKNADLALSLHDQNTIKPRY